MLRGLFIHGGPGLNSEPERRLLVERIAAAGIQLHFWSEPSLKRPDGYLFQKERAFARWLESIEQTIKDRGSFDLLVGSSFGALGALHILKRNPTAFSRCLMISPVLDVSETFRKMMLIASNDFKESRPEASAELLSLRQSTRSLRDASMKKAMSLAYEDPQLVGHYFFNKQALQDWAAVLGEPRFAMDLESQDAVLDDLINAQDPWPAAPLPMPVQVLVGNHDPVVTLERSLELLTPHFSQLKKMRFQNSGHFLHLEETDKFIGVLSSFT